MISSGALWQGAINIICQFLLDINLTTTWYQNILLLIRCSSVNSIFEPGESPVATHFLFSIDNWALGVIGNWNWKVGKTRKSPFLSNFPLLSVLQLEMWIKMHWVGQWTSFASQEHIIRVKGANSLFSFQHNCYIVWGALVLKTINNVMWWLKMFCILWSLLTQTGLPGAYWLSVTSPSVHLLRLTEPLNISREALDSFS